jgi:hypothetical protein
MSWSALRLGVFALKNWFETQRRKDAKGGGMREEEGRRQETGDRRQESGVRRQKTEVKRPPAS